MKKLKMIPILKTIALSTACVGIGILAALAISSVTDFKLQDTLFVEGLIMVMIGLMLSMQGNPSGTNLQGLGQQNANQTASWNLEVTRIERNSTNYYKNFLKHSIVSFAYGNLILIFSGILIILISILYFS